MKALIDGDRECNTCKEVKPLKEFPKNKECFGGHTPKCKTCYYIKQEEWRKANIERVRERNRNRCRDMKKKAVDMFGNKCSDCSETYHQSVYEFHHTDPSEKDISPANARSWKSMKEELKKCVMLCANCHRLRHYANEESSDSLKEGR